MTKKEIVKQLCEKANAEKLFRGNITQLATKELVQWTFKAIIDALVENGRIELRNFGVFEVKQRKPRKARNPRTGARVEVAAKNVVSFQPGKVMEERVRKFGKPIEDKRKSRKAPPPLAQPTPMTVPTPLNTPSTNGTGAAATPHEPATPTAAE